MTNNTLRLSCEQLEGRDLPAPVAGVQYAPVVQRPTLAAPVVQRIPAPVVTPVQTLEVVALPSPTPGTMRAPQPGTAAVPDKFGQAVETIGVPISLTVTAVKTGAEILNIGPLASAAEGVGRRADFASLIGPAVQTANRTGSGVQVGTAVLVNANVQIWGSRIAGWVGSAVGGRVGPVVGAAILTAVFPEIPLAMAAGALVGARIGPLIGQGTAVVTFTWMTTWKGFQDGVASFSKWVGDQYQPSNGLIAGTRPAPTVMIPRGR